MDNAERRAVSTEEAQQWLAALVGRPIWVRGSMKQQGNLFTLAAILEDPDTGTWNLPAWSPAGLNDDALAVAYLTTSESESMTGGAEWLDLRYKGGLRLTIDTRKPPAAYPEILTGT